jgi:hypothetical protein
MSSQKLASSGSAWRTWLEPNRLMNSPKPNTPVVLPCETSSAPPTSSRSPFTHRYAAAHPHQQPSARPPLVRLASRSSPPSPATASLRLLQSTPIRSTQTSASSSGTAWQGHRRVFFPPPRSAYRCPYYWTTAPRTRIPAGRGRPSHGPPRVHLVVRRRGQPGRRDGGSWRPRPARMATPASEEGLVVACPRCCWRRPPAAVVGHVREPAGPDNIHHSFTPLPPQPAAASELPLPIPLLLLLSMYSFQIRFLFIKLMNA